MAKRVTMLSTTNETAENGPAPDTSVHPTDSLEQRVQRLEDAVAALQDTRPLEDRVVERISEQLGITPPKREPEPRTEYMVMAERRTPATPAEQVPAQESVPPPSAASLPLMTRHPWLLFDLLGEVRAMIRMFFDVHYHVAWSTRVTVLILLPLIFTSGWWCPFAFVPIVGPLVVKALDLILAFFVYQALSREARRYRTLKAAGMS